MRALLALLALLLTVPASVESQRRETGFLFRTLTLGDSTYRYQVYVPPGYTPRRRWPVILFLHGSGERGADGLVQTQVGLGAAIRRGVERWPAIVVMPQARPEQSWTREMERVALAALARTERELRTDPARIYLTGLSMGGYGTWSIAARHPGRFAALLVVCGGIHPPARVPFPRDETGFWELPDPYAAYARALGRTPVWIFHGDTDPVVPVDESRRMHAALQAAGADVRYTELPGLGHNAWDPAYTDPAVPAWLLAQRLPSPPRRP